MLNSMTKNGLLISAILQANTPDTPDYAEIIKHISALENDFDSDLSQEDDLNGWNYRKDK